MLVLLHKFRYIILQYFDNGLCHILFSHFAKQLCEQAFQSSNSNRNQGWKFRHLAATSFTIGFIIHFENSEALEAEIAAPASNNLFVVSNRLPLSVTETEEGLEFNRSSGGLVSAMSGAFSGRCGSLKYRVAPVVQQ